ncbi:outer membrane protein [Sphingomonas faeni]|uniref:outer membrane protein n=1 Tax=Sphingomonas faeni TaxID=185950 RepID=UPI0027859F9C|nr:porin family protein [Sphingomonas faeni]MDQ0839304.1 outer membrane immunogenic protein [Sphingomonas faeni]
MIKNRILTACIATAAASVCAVSAQAQTEVPFSGPYVAAIGGWDRVDGDHHGETGFDYGGIVGYDVAAGSVRVGPEVELTGSTAKGCVGTAATEKCIRSGRDLFVGGRLGVVATSQVLAYVMAGYTNANFDRYAPGRDKDILEKKAHSGARIGVGVEYALSNAAFLKTEYRYSRYSHGVSRNQILGGIGIRF